MMNKNREKYIENNFGDGCLINTHGNLENVQVIYIKEKYIEKSMKQLLKEEENQLLVEINEKIMRKIDLMNWA